MQRERVPFARLCQNGSSRETEEDTGNGQWRRKKRRADILVGQHRDMAGGKCIIEYRNVLLHWPFRKSTSFMEINGSYRCGANMVCRLPCCSCSPSTLASPLGIGRGAAGSYSDGVLRPTRFAVALMRSSWVMSCVGLYRSTSSCEERRTIGQLTVSKRLPGTAVKSGPTPHLVNPPRPQKDDHVFNISRKPGGVRRTRLDRPPALKQQSQMLRNAR